MTLTGLIRQAYPSPEWATFFEVSDSTGWRSKRRADAVALGIWPSRGQTIIGFEFKEDRRDWLREKEDPAKAEVIAAHCDCWYVVAGSEGIVKDVDELPEPWGLLVANKERTRLRAVKACVPFPDRDKSVMKRSFAAAMLRKVNETTVPRVELDRIVEERLKEAVERSTAGYELKRLRDRVDHLEKTQATFRDITGVNLDDWRGPENIAKAVNAVLRLGSDADAIRRARAQLTVAATTMDEALAAWPVQVSGDVPA